MYVRTTGSGLGGCPGCTGLSGFGAADPTTVALQITACVAPALFTRSLSASNALCVFDALVDAAVRTDEVSVMLRTIVDSTCSDFLSSLGINATAAAVICVPLAPYWINFQSWAGTRLDEMRAEGTTEEMVPPEEGGGRLITYPDGTQEKFCPITHRDASGAIIGYSEGLTPLDEPCTRRAPPPRVTGIVPTALVRGGLPSGVPLPAEAEEEECPAGQVLGPDGVCVAEDKYKVEPEGMSTGTKVALALGAVALVGGGIWYLAKARR